MALQIGDKAPSFKTIDQNDKEISLEALKGKKVILYFYPKDNTPGCTVQGCNLRDNYSDLIKQGYEVLGISADTQKKHQNFASKYQFPFSLLVDVEFEIIKKYDVWKEKSMFGKKYMGIVRTTFVIDENGIISDIITKVDTENHTEQIVKK